MNKHTKNQPDNSQTERKAQNERMAGINRAAGAAALTGKDTHIQQAETIRATVFETITTIITAIQPKTENLPILHKITNSFTKPDTQPIQQALQWLKEHTSATCWINNWECLPPGGNEIQRAYDLITNRKKRPPNPEDIRKHFLLLWPGLTIENAQTWGIEPEFRNQLIKEAQEKAEKEKQEQEANKAKNQQEDEELAHTLGLKGKINIWCKTHPQGKQHRIYAGRQFTYHHTGSEAEKLENSTNLDDETLIRFARRLCQRWENVKLKVQPKKSPGTQNTLPS
jgi:hypothetical protein